MGSLLKLAWEAGKTVAVKGSQAISKVDPTDVLGQSTVDEVLKLARDIHHVFMR